MQVVPLFSAAEVAARIADLAERLYRDYADSPLSLVRVSDGAARFVEALATRLAGHGMAPEIHSLHARRGEGRGRGAVQVDAFEWSLLDGRDVLIVDDVVDEGATLGAVLEIVGLAETRSLRTAVLVDKRARRRGDFAPDYAGFEVAGGWVVGFGMDVDGELRELDEIGVVVDD